MKLIRDQIIRNDDDDDDAMTLGISLADPSPWAARRPLKRWEGHVYLFEWVGPMPPWQMENFFNIRSTHRRLDLW